MGVSKSFSTYRPAQHNEFTVDFLRKQDGISIQRAGEYGAVPDPPVGNVGIWSLGQGKDVLAGLSGSDGRLGVKDRLFRLRVKEVDVAQVHYKVNRPACFGLRFRRQRELEDLLANDDHRHHRVAQRLHHIHSGPDGVICPGQGHGPSHRCPGDGHPTPPPTRYSRPGLGYLVLGQAEGKVGRDHEQHCHLAKLRLKPTRLNSPPRRRELRKRKNNEAKWGLFPHRSRRPRGFCPHACFQFPPPTFSLSPRLPPAPRPGIVLATERA